MGDLQRGRIDGLLAVEKNVQVDFARASGELFFAAHLRFDGLEDSQECGCFQLCFRFHHTVQKPRLIEIIHRFGFIKRGHLFDVQVVAMKRRDCCAEIGVAVADV